MTLVSCDAKGGCVEEFRSCSVPNVIGDQLALYGWTVKRTGRGKTASTEYLCPKHRPLGPMERRA